MPDSRFRPGAWALAAGLALAGAGGAPAAAAGLPYEDLVRLLQARMPDTVLIALIEAEGAPALSASQWLELRERGASDAVLESLVPLPADPVEPPPEPNPPPPGPASSAGPEPAREGPRAAAAFRAFFVEGSGGREVFVLTNVDEEGKRLDGETARPVRANLVAGRPFDPERERQLAEEERRARQAPPEPSPAETRAAPAAAGHPLLPENLPPPPAAFVSTGWYGGFLYPYPMSHFYPPGSHTHLKLYHQGGEPGLSHYSLPSGPVLYGPLFPAAGSHRPRRP